MKDIEKFEKLVDDIEKSIPTLEFIKEQANINVVSIKKYFPQAYQAKYTTITGVYVIFTKSKEKYINSSKDILNQINMYIRDTGIKNILVVYIYETEYIDAKHLESWLVHKLILEPNIEDEIRKNAIEEIKEKIRKNPKFLSTVNKEKLEYQEKLKFANGNDFTNWMQRVGIMKSPTDVERDKLNNFLKRKKYKNRKEQLDILAKNRGLENDAEYQRIMSWNSGRRSPYFENENCTMYLGICIGEELFKVFLLTYFESVRGFHPHNRGFDFICKDPRQEFIERYPHLELERNKEYMIQLKLLCLQSNDDGWTGWNFHIDHNHIPDFFILSAWDDREFLNPMHVWMFHKNDIIRKKEFWQRIGLCITNKQKHLEEYIRYELVYELERLKEVKELMVKQNRR